MELKLLAEKTKATDLKSYAENWYIDFLKGCVDLENKKVAVGGDYHMETCEFLTSLGGSHKNVWGFNVRYLENGENIIEVNSLVNIKPNVNKGREVESDDIRNQVINLVKEFIEL
jgi:hypothetical protein